MSSAAALDKRRINGPDRTFQPIYRSSTDGAAAAENADDEELSGQGSAISGLLKGKQRMDGRGATDLRPIYIQTSLIPQANGSCYLEAGGLKLACAVYGPRGSVRNTRGGGSMMAQAELNVECRYAPFANVGGGRTKPGKNLESTLLSSRIHSALLPSIRLSLLPKSSLDVYLTVIEADGPLESCVALGVTAASAALATAGIELWGLCIGTVGAYVPSEQSGSSAGADEKAQGKGLLIVDPTRSESLPQAVSTRSVRPKLISLCSMPALGSITSLDVSCGSNSSSNSGRSDEDEPPAAQVNGSRDSSSLTITEMDDVVRRLTEAAAQIHLVVAQALQEDVAAREEAATAVSTPGR